jgi:hypothetical protein
VSMITGRRTLSMEVNVNFLSYSTERELYTNGLA